MRKVYLLLFLSFISGGVWGQSIWTNPITDPNPSAANPFTLGDVSDPGITVSGIGRGSGIAAAAASNRYNANSWNTAGIDLTAYFDFTLTPNAGNAINFVSFVYTGQASGTGPTTFAFRSSVDGFTADIGSPIATGTTINLSGGAYQNISAGITFRIYGWGASAGGGTFSINDFTFNGTIVSTSNSISVTAVNTSPFNLTDCSDTETGTVQFSSIGTFTGNTYTAQLSDATGSFATPVPIGSLSSDLNSGTINIVIPAGTATGTLYKIRVVSSSPVVFSSLSADLTVNQAGSCSSSATDYFRSKATGNWNATSTWESSPDNATWLNATLTPTSAANTITIRNGNTVTVTASTTVDQVVIENLAVLIYSAGTFTIDDWAGGDDIDIQTGGIFTLAQASTPPTWGAGSPTVNVATGGMLRITTSGLTSAAPANGVNISNFVYRHQSILEYTLNGGFSTSNVTYFPNVTAAVIPIFRTTNTGNLLIGSNNPTIFNGVFEAMGTAVVRWQNAGNKTFRNGLRGSGNIDVDAATIGISKFIINGVTAELGGTGSLTVPATNGLEIGSAGGTTVAVSSNKIVTGDVSLISTNTYIDLIGSDLTVSGTITGGGPAAYIRTHGSGVLTLNAIAFGGGTKTFPIGSSSYNPLVIVNNDVITIANFSAGVEDGIIPGIAFPTYGIQRTWNISASAAITDADITFQYASADAGVNAAQPQDMEILMNSGAVWNVIAAQTNITPGGADPAWTINTNSIGMPVNTTLTPYVLGIDGGYILPIDCIISCRSSKQNSNGIINWDVSTCSEVMSFEVQRSVNGGAYTTVATIVPGAPLSYSYTDASLANGTNLYRIKVTGNTGAVKYSNTVAIINDIKGLLITALSPNPVNDKSSLVINAAKPGTVSFVITDIAGRPVKQWKATITEGSNIIQVNATALSNGIYHLSATTGDSRTVVRFVKQ
ncbi:MAG TPA: T9SS type A sorting domain-containing protein [Chitinophagaceae bacterium]|jgi:hypothetical protein|nr:T9SS type A sorting domain-containing protein [Chitinophagaceae bacterium]